MTVVLIITYLFVGGLTETVVAPMGSFKECYAKGYRIAKNFPPGVVEYKCGIGDPDERV